MPPLKHVALSLIATASLVLVSACSKIPSDIRDESDPWESFNRGSYQFTYVVDGVLLKPITQVYRGVIPEVGREKVHNFFQNLGEPVTFGNSVLQGNPENSFATLWRFLINSSFGVAGLFDAASEIGLKNHDADFGQTLALYGVESGPYLFIPIMGPSGARDGVGVVADIFMNPTTYVDDTGTSIALWTGRAINGRSDNYDLIEDVYRSSLDPYVTFKSGYQQRRANDIKKARAARDAAWKKAGFI